MNGKEVTIMRKLLILLATLLISISSFVFAQTKEKTFTLREAPDANARIVAQMAVGSPIMPIIRQNGWVKVADPKTGRVGWVQSDKLEKSPVVITQVIAGGNNYCKDNDCQFSFYSSTSRPLTPQENDRLWQRIHVQERYLLSQQAAMQKQMNEFMDDLNTLMAQSITTTHTQQANKSDTQFQNKNAQKTSRKPAWKFWDDDRK